MNDRHPLVTVLIGTYNRPDFLKEAIASVVGQTMTDWELLVMNDGGVDVRHVVEGFQDPRIQYFHDEVNRGLAHRLNFGLREGRGTYIAYLGDDDLFYPNHLQVLTEALARRPDVGVAYSDLYAVSFVKDETTGRRYPLRKFVQVSRDFNREFMFYFNHTLHVSLLHRRDLALKAGGYNEDVKVLIDWDLTRKMCFFTDFLYVPQITGEYYMPIQKSDRISVRERQDPEGFKHNLRKIKADLPPPGDWTHVRRVAVLLPVATWDEDLCGFLSDLADKTYYPHELVLINTDPDLDEAACRERLGKLNDLKSLRVLIPGERLEGWEAYARGLAEIRADYVYLFDRKSNWEVELRLFALLNHMLRFPDCTATRLDIKDEREFTFNVFLKPGDFDRFRADTRDGRNPHVDLATNVPPAGLVFDVLFERAHRCYREKNYREALKFFQAASSIKTGIPGEQYLNDLHAKIALGLKDYAKAEEKCRSLIERGYQADNWVKLGQILQAQKRYAEAIAAYQNGLRQLGLRESDLADPIFPIVYPTDFEGFTALIGQGECYVGLGDFGRAVKTFHRASRIKADSHRPFLGFAKMFLAQGEFNRAHDALKNASRQGGGKDPEVHRLAGELCEREDRLELAFSCFRKAFELDNTDPETVKHLLRVGSKLERWEDLKKALEEFIQDHPGHVEALAALAEIYLRDGQTSKAEALVARGRVLDRWHEGLLRLDFRIRHAGKPYLAGLDAPAADNPLGQA